MSQRNDSADLARAVMELIDRVHCQLSRHLDLTRIQVLGTVAAWEPVRPAAISAELGLTASATSRHLARPDRDVTTALELVTRLNQAWAERDGTVTSPPGTGPRWRRARDSEGEQ